jgi:phenylalanyl-tRNA synthetase beta chain
MKFSHAWLLDYLDAAPSASEVAAALTSVGLAVESVEGDRLEVEVTTNRPDAMCHLGLARELAVKLGCGLRAPSFETGAPPLRGLTVEIQDLADCSWYTAREIDGVRVGPSPEWMQERLRAVGVRPINNVVDVTNYVLWEMGQPLHAFDRALLADRIVVRRGRPGESVVTLDGVERRVDPSILVIADGVRPLALAGVMGGAAEGVGDGTTGVLLESAHFRRAAVRAAARACDLHTDASHRFERGVDPSLCAAASARAAALLGELCGARTVGVAQAGGPLAEHPTGRLEHRRLERFGGFPIARTEADRILRGLGFGVDGELVTVPSWRSYDMAPGDDRAVEEQDLFEEVLRHVGFERTPSTLPELSGADAGEARAHAWRERVRDFLAAAGFAEAIDYAFHSAAADRTYPSLVDGEALRLRNPLSEHYGVMRRSLLPGLVESAGYNLRRGAGAVALFEVGHLFGRDGELDAVALVLGGTRGVPWEGGRRFDVFDLKGAVEGIAALAGAPLTVEPASLAGFAAGGASRLGIGSVVVGHFGRLDDPAGEHPYPLFAAEIAFTGWERAERALAVTLPSRQPAVAVDLTLRHALTTPWRDLAATIEEARRPELASFRLVDRYRGSGVPPGAVATTLRFVYQSQDRSLEQEEVNAWHQALAADLERRYGWREDR